MYLIRETEMRSIPSNIVKQRDKIRMECILQTCGDINRNKRMYKKDIMIEGINKILPRVKDGSFIGELDHPISTDPSRQVTVWYKEASHRIVDLGWDGNKLVGVLETLRTPNGTILKNLAEDGVPVGFSFRGMGDLKQVSENGNQYNEVIGPVNIITWDSVSLPSHETARLLKITESMCQEIKDGARKNLLSESHTIIYEDENVICTKEGFCYIPNEFDKLVEQRYITLRDKFKI